MHSLTETELEGIASLGNSLNLAFLGISVGALVAFAITLGTVNIPDPTEHATFAALTWISALATLYFAARSCLDHRAAKRRLRDILSSD